MSMYRIAGIVGIAVAGSFAAGQIIPVIQERSVQANISVSSGGTDSEGYEAPDFGAFNRNVNIGIGAAGGAQADATASQNSLISGSMVTGSLNAAGSVRTGTTFITGESDSECSYLFIFNLNSASQIHLIASGGLSYFGRNPDGEPSDLYGMTSVRLINAITEDQISGYTLNVDPGAGAANFDGVLAAGQYAILARTHLHAFSADLLGPPARSGSGNSSATFTLEVVPTPAGSSLLAVGLLGAMRRRR